MDDQRWRSRSVLPWASGHAGIRCRDRRVLYDWSRPIGWIARALIPLPGRQEPAGITTGSGEYPRAGHMQRLRPVARFRPTGGCRLAAACLGRRAGDHQLHPPRVRVHQPAGRRHHHMPAGRAGRHCGNDMPAAWSRLRRAVVTAPAGTLSACRPGWRHPGRPPRPAGRSRSRTGKTDPADPAVAQAPAAPPGRKRGQTETAAAGDSSC